MRRNNFSTAAGSQERSLVYEEEDDSEEEDDFAGREDQYDLRKAPMLGNTKFYASVGGFDFRGLGKSLLLLDTPGISRSSPSGSTSPSTWPARTTTTALTPVLGWTDVRGG